MDIQRSKPVALSERIASLDVLRGVAVLGILLMNIVSFSMVTAAYELPTVYNDMAGPDWWTWLVLHYIADTKFMSIFSILFGAGVCIFMERANSKGHSVWKLQTSRMGWLFVIGILHAYLLWFGDILVTYAISGMLIATVRNWKPAVLFILGFALMFIIPIVFKLFIFWTMQFWPEKDVLAMQQSVILDSPEVQLEIAAYTGSWLDQLPHRVSIAFMLQFIILPLYLLWHCVGLMMVGMAAYKLNILSASKSVRFYIVIIALSALIGFPLIAIGVWQKQLHDWDPATVQFLVSNWNSAGGVFIAFVWICLVMLVCKLGMLTYARKALAATGQMALTNYLGQTIICTFIFYGHGLGLFGQLERVELLYVAVAIWVFQIIFSMFWLSKFRFGPFEWLWRSATYLKWQPIVRKN
ncbi:MAG: DUF418 domain-containing protein [Phycisphaerae bacterium]|nr:DUF418 domain-containing protein [Phycisphaerae bacterium]